MCIGYQGLLSSIVIKDYLLLRNTSWLPNINDGRLVGKELVKELNVANGITGESFVFDKSQGVLC